MFGLEFIKKLKPCKWRYNDSLDDGTEHFGFIAQDVNEIVNHKQYALVVKDNGLYKLNMIEFIGPIVQAIQELERRVVILEKGKNNG